MAKLKWKVIHDCDDDEGNVTCWSTETIIRGTENTHGFRIMELSMWKWSNRTM